MAVAVLLSVPSYAASFDAKPNSANDAASDGVFGFCPLFLAGQFPLKDNPQLTIRGYAASIAKETDPKYGDIEQVTATFSDGIISFGGVDGKICRVKVKGKASAGTPKATRDSMKLFPIKLAPYAVASGKKQGQLVEAYKGELEPGNSLNLVILTPIGRKSNSGVTVQLFVTEN